MADKILPTVNFNANPGFDEFKFLHEIYSQEFKARSQISSRSGIVDFFGDPSSAPFTPGRPLLVSVSSVNPLSLDIARGYAVTPSNLLIDIDAAIPSLPLPGLVAGKTYIVAAEYKLVASEAKELSRFGELTEVRLERPANIPFGGGASTLLNAITIADINDFNNASFFNDERKNNLVVLAVVQVFSDPTTGALSLSVDLSSETYTFNRPWFTIVDIEHRSKIGSGIVTDNNPHGTELQDLSSAGLTLYQQLRGRGGVVAKDSSLYGYPGSLCTEIIPPNRFQVDDNGLVTGEGSGRYYVQLQKLPIRVGSLYHEGTPWKPVPYVWREGTNIISLGPLEEPSEYEGNLIFEYFAVDALEVSGESLTQGLQTLNVKAPIDGIEFIVSSGSALGTLSQTTLQLPSLLGPIKRYYQVLANKEGSLVLSPQPLSASIRVSDLKGAATAAQTLNQAPQGGVAVPLQIGLTRALERKIVGVGIYDLNLRLRITGINNIGSAVQEEVAFKASQWKEQSPTALREEPLQIKTTKNKFSLVQSIQVINTVAEPDNAGPDAIISLWADVLDADIYRELASAGSFFWTGTTGRGLKDERTIASTLTGLVHQPRELYSSHAVRLGGTFPQEMLNAILSPALTDPSNTPKLLMFETDTDRYFAETWREFSTADASASISLSQWAAVSLNQTIRIGADKYLKIVASGANPSLGEVNLGSSDITLKNNIIQTINDPIWDSGWAASLGQGSTPPINITRAEGYAEGLAVATRKIITFLADITAGTFKFDLNGQTIGPVAFSLDNDTTIAAIVSAINAANIGGVTAGAYAASPRHVITLLGDRDGHTFTVSNVVSASGMAAANVSVPFESFSVSSVTGGRLPSNHLPRRYPSPQHVWSYLTRPYLWPRVGLRASLRFNGDNPALISNLDALEISPGRVIYAKRGGAITADPSAGEFLVDLASLTNTLNNLITAVNHPDFSSGVKATIAEDNVSIDFEIGGTAAAQIRLMVESVQGTWLTTPYENSFGDDPENAHLLLYSLLPLASAEYRVSTVEEPSVLGDWTSMEKVSSSLYTLDLSEIKPYAIQLRLVGESQTPNGFVLYQYTPQTSGATLPAVDSRVQAVESELTAARGSTSDLAARLSQVIDVDGSLIQDEELTAARYSGNIAAAAPALKARLDNIESHLELLAMPVSESPLRAANYSALRGGEAEIISGPTDAQGNLSFFQNTGAVLQVGGSISTPPLVLALNGYSFIYPRSFPVDFTGLQAGTYYVNAELTPGAEAGRTVLSSTITTLAGLNGTFLIDSTKNFGALDLQADYIVVFPTITNFLGHAFFATIASVNSATSLQLAGGFPSTLPVGTPYEIRAPRELSFTSSQTRTPDSSRKLTVGQVTFNGTSAFSEMRSYRRRYVSDLKPVQAAPNYETTFEHNLGRLPGVFQIYVHTSAAGDVSPKVLQIGDEAVVKTSATTMTVKNRYASLVARDYAGNVLTTAWLQLVI